MYVRLAFAVAAHLEPEILIVDEVLAVGDAEFQAKCSARWTRSPEGGRTVLFVSHNMGVITSLCANVVWLDKGEARDKGPSREISAEYLSRQTSHRDRALRLTDVARPGFAQGDDRVRIEAIEWLSGIPLQHGQEVRARIHFATRAPVPSISVGIGFSSVEGTRLLSYETDLQDSFRPNLTEARRYTVDVGIPALPLAPDIYGLDVGCRSGNTHCLDYLPACAQVEVIPGPTTPGHIISKGAGARLPSDWIWDFAKRPKIVAQ